MAKASGAPLVILNRDPTDYDAMADLVLHREIGPVLSGAMALLSGQGGAERRRGISSRTLIPAVASPRARREARAGERTPAGSPPPGGRGRGARDGTARVLARLGTQRRRAWNFWISAAAACPRAPRMVASVSIAIAVSTSE